MKKIIKWAFFIIIALIVIRVLAGPNEESKKAAEASSGEQPADIAESAPPQKEVFRISAGKLFRDYEENEVAADERMKGKQIAVTGVVQAIDKDFTDAIIIRLKTDNQFMPARMEMVDSQKSTALTLKKGSQVEVVCQSISRIMGAPSGRRCVFN
ncbi:OB-fold protein [Erwinia sp. BNK-24-b]|uniref:OB-fold protein n=1 Tax=unclassified Erwinia TaxID=2622719 RepID=UPI0039BFB31F